MNKKSREELKQKALAANKAHGGLPWQVTMARHDGVTHYHIRGHCEPAIAVVKNEYWEDDYEPPVDDYGYIQPDERMDCDPARVDIARHIAAANPAAIQSLLAYVDRLEAQRDRLLNACKASITVMDLLRTTGDDAKSWYAQDRNGAMVKVSDVIKSCKEAITEAESQT